MEIYILSPFFSIFLKGVFYHIRAILLLFPTWIWYPEIVGCLLDEQSKNDTVYLYCTAFNRVVYNYGFSVFSTTFHHNLIWTTIYGRETMVCGRCVKDPFVCHSEK
jgi:hypothetical protein